MSGRRLRPVAKTPVFHEVLGLRSPLFRVAGADLQLPVPVVPAAPALSTFVEDDFVNAFFGGVAASGGASWNAGAWSPLRGFRDWAEPPAAMLNARGSRRYPASLVRRTPLSGEVWAAGGPDEAQLETDGATPDAPWVRKLYLPMHRHFHMVSADLYCERYKQPPVDRRRVLASGAVVRRVVPRTDAVQFDDWLPGVEATGVWVRGLFDASMRPSGGGDAVDPQRLPDAAFAGATGLKIRLGLPASQPLTLSSATLAVLPAQSPDKQPLGPRTVVYGYVPVWSSETRAPEAASTPTTAQLAYQAMRDVLDAMPPAEVGASMNQLYTLVNAWARTVLKTVTGVDAARTTVEGHVYDPSGADIRYGEGATVAQLNNVLNTGRGELIDALLSTVTTLSGTVPNGPFASGDVTAWFDAALNDAWTAVDALYSGAANQEWIRSLLDTREPQVRVLIHAAVLELVSPVAAGSWEPPTGNALSDLKDLLAVLLRYTRRARYELAVAWMDDVYGGQPPDGVNFVADFAALTLRVLGAEIAVWDEATLLPVDQQLPAWRSQPGPPSGSDEVLETHRACLAVEVALDAYELAASTAGVGYARAIEARATSSVGSAPWSTLGATVDLLQQPARGLVLFPTLWADATPTSVTRQNPQGTVEAVLDPTGVAVSAYDQVVGGASAEAISIASSTSSAAIPRFDQDSLYVIAVWVRVAGRDACEPERVVWSTCTEPFRLAEPMDLLGLKPVSIRMPDLKEMARNIPRIPKAGAFPFAAVSLPPDSDASVDSDPKIDAAREWGIAWICSFGIPVFTICAWILFKIILAILLIIPGFAWLLLLKFCIPIPRKES
jgi:hypothetical protein